MPVAIIICHNLAGLKIETIDKKGLFVYSLSKQNLMGLKMEKLNCTMRTFFTTIMVFVFGLALSQGLSARGIQSDSASGQKKLEQLTLYSPPVGVGVVLVDVVKSGALDAYADTVDVVRWDSPDQLRAGIMDKSIDITFVPSYVGANLYNKGIDFKLLNIMSNGLLYVLSSDTSIKNIEDLKGKEIVVPFPNDMPDLVLQALLKKAGLNIGTDVILKHVPTPTVAAKLAITGEADIVLLPEIAGTKVSIMAKKKRNADIRHVIDIQKEWGRLFNMKPSFPLAGVAVRASFADAHPELLKTLHNAMVTSAEALLNDKDRLAAMTEVLWKGEGPIFVKSIDKWRLSVRTSAAARADLESFYTILKDLNPKIIGGKLPDDGFYWDVE